jgi:hypothetical protein
MRTQYTVRELIAELKRSYNMDDLVYAPLWTGQDVEQTKAGSTVENPPRLPDEYIRKVFNLIDRTHNAEIGVNWDVIECAIEEVDSHE